MTALFLLGTVLIAGTPAAAEEVKVLKSAGCKTEYFLMKDLADSYAAKTGTRIQLGNTGNKKAMNLLMDHRINFAFTCKTIDQLARKLKLDPKIVGTWKSVPVAIDPIVIVANRDNGVENLSRAQLTELFQGKIRNWKELGGNDLAVITAYMNPALESGVTLLFKEFTVGIDGKLDESAHLGDGPSNLGHYISLHPGAVTFMGLNSYDENDGVILSIDGVAPSRENIFSGAYNLAATYYLTLTGEENREVSDFINFVQSEEGAKAIKVNFIPYAQ